MTGHRLTFHRVGYVPCHILRAAILGQSERSRDVLQEDTSGATSSSHLCRRGSISIPRVTTATNGTHLTQTFCSKERPTTTYTAASCLNRSPIVEGSW